jgi:hypothetical protein
MCVFLYAFCVCNLTIKAVRVCVCSSFTLSQIVVLRDPVSRVWSFYQYVRRKLAAFQERPLVHFLHTWREFIPNATSMASTGFSPHSEPSFVLLMCHTHAQSAHMRVYTLEYKRARECAIAAQAL